MGKWTKFNSRLLETLQSASDQTFYQKLLQLTVIFMGQKDLETSLKEIFKPSETPIAIPTINDLQNYGKGLGLGKRTEVLMYLENAVFDLLNEKPRRPIQEMNLPDQYKYNELDPIIQKYLVLIYGLSGDPSLSSLKINSLDDIAFTGLLSAIETARRKDIFHVTWTTAGGTTVKHRQNPMTQHIPIPEPIFKEMFPDRGFQSNHLWTFEILNISEVPLDTKPLKIEEAIPYLLSQGSFLWESGVFNLSQDQILAMTEGERALYLLENQAKGLEAAMDFLGESIDFEGKYDYDQARLNHVKQRATLLTEKMKAKKQIERLYFEAAAKRKSLEKRFQAIQEELGASGDELIPPTEMLQLYASKSTNLNFTTPIGRLVGQTLEGYKAALFEERALKEDLNEFENKIFQFRKAFEVLLSGILEQSLATATTTNKQKNDLLTVYTYLSMIFLNDEIFPEASSEVLEKKAGRVKKNVKKTFQKWKRFAAKKKEQRLETLGEDSIFQGMLDQRERTLYSEYYPQSKSYRYKALSTADLTAFAATARSIIEEAQEGRAGAIKKFNKLKELLEKSLNDDNAFLKELDHLQGYSREKIAAMTAYVEAAKIFAAKDDPSNFSKVMDTIFKALSERGLKESALKSKQKFLTSARNLSVVASPASSELERTLDMVVRRVQGEAAQDFDLAPSLIQTQDPELEGMKKELLAEGKKFRSDVFSRGLLWDYEDLEEILRRQTTPPTAPLNISPGLREDFEYPDLIGEQETYEDAYEAIRSLWKMLMRHAPKERAKSTAPYKYSIQEHPDILARALYIHRLMEEVERRQVLTYKVIPAANLSRTPDKIDIFANQSLFKFYEGRFVDHQKNQRRAGEAYNYFLPVFVANFTAVENRWRAGALREAKLKIIEQLPDARTTFQEVERWRQDNSAAINDINQWILEEIRKNTTTLQNQPEEQAALIERLFREGMKKCQETMAHIERAAYSAIENVLYSSLLGVGVFYGLAHFGILALGGAVLGGIPTLGVTLIFSLLGGAFIYNKGIDFAKTALKSFIENVNAFLGRGDYNLTAPADMLMNLIENALTNEIHCMDKFTNMQHKMNYAFYIQEFFNVLQQMQTDLTTFRERAASLLPYMAEQANFSVMGCNMFCMLSKDLFLRVSPDLLRKTQHPLFIEAVEEYLKSYKIALQQKAQGFRGEQVFLFKSETPFSRYMRKDPLYLEFPLNSAVGRVFGESKIFMISTDQILPFEQLNPSREAQQVSIFLEKGKNLLSLKELFDRKLQRILNESHNAARYERPLSQEWLSQAREGLNSSMEMLSFAFQQAYEMRGRTTNPYLQATGESPETIFSSKLFRDSLSILQKTADFAKGLGLESGMRIKALLDELSFTSDSFLRTGMLYLPPFQLWHELKENLDSLLQSMANGYPTLGYPILLEFVENKGAILPQLIWLFLKGSLGTEGSLQMIEDSNSRLTYLTGQNLEVFTSNPQARNFFLTPYMINAFEQAVISGYTNPELLNFLGRNEQMAQEIRRAAQNPMTRWLSAITPEQRQQIEAPQRAYGETYFGQPQAASNMVNPSIGLAPRQYDPENIGIPPEEALNYYGNRLEPAVQQQLSQLPERQAVPQGRPQIMPPVQPPLAIEQAPGMQQQQGAYQPQRQNRPTEEMPLLMPMMIPQGEMEAPMQQQVPTTEQATPPVSTPQLEAVPQETYAPQRVHVGGNGMPSGSAPSQVQMLQPMNQNPPPEMPMPLAPPVGSSSFPPPAAEPFVNPSTMGYNPQAPQGWNWQAMAGIGAIGAGAAMGAALLAQTTRNENKRKRSRGKNP